MVVEGLNLPGGVATSRLNNEARGASVVSQVGVWVLDPPLGHRGRMLSDPGRGNPRRSEAVSRVDLGEDQVVTRMALGWESPTRRAEE